MLTLLRRQIMFVRVLSYHLFFSFEYLWRSPSNSCSSTQRSIDFSSGHAGPCNINYVSNYYPNFSTLSPFHTNADVDIHHSNSSLLLEKYNMIHASCFNINNNSQIFSIQRFHHIQSFDFLAGQKHDYDYNYDYYYYFGTLKDINFVIKKTL